MATADVINSIYSLPAAEVTIGNHVIIRGRPCKVKNVHHVIFSTPVMTKYGHRTVEIKGIDMITKINHNWIGYGYMQVNLFYPVRDKLLFISLTNKFVLGLNTHNKMICVLLAKNDPLRSSISEKKWSGDLHVLKIPIVNGKEMEDITILEKVTPWI